MNEDIKFIGFISISIVTFFVLVFSIICLMFSCSKIDIAEEEKLFDAVESVAEVVTEVELGFNPHLEKTETQK